MGEKNPTASGQDDLLAYAGYVGIAIAVVLTVAVAAVSLGGTVLPTGPILGTIVFTVVMIVVGVLTHQTGQRHRPH